MTAYLGKLAKKTVGITCLVVQGQLILHFTIALSQPMETPALLNIPEP